MNDLKPHLFWRKVKRSPHYTKGRSGAASGEQNGNACLTLEKAEFIRQAQKQGLSYSQLAERFQVSKSTIASIIRKETWKT